MSTRDDFIAQAYLKLRLPLFRFLKRRLGNAEDAEDLMQESFARWSATRSQGLPDNPKAYLTRIALNAAYEAAGGRAGRHVATVPLEESLGGGAQGAAMADLACPQRQAETRQALDRLSQALHELPQRQREAFVRHRFDGLSYEAIAEEMQISRAMVSRHISHAVAYCRLRVDYPSRQAMLAAMRAKEADDAA